YLASINKKVVEAIKNLQSHSSSNPTSISQAAALEAIKGGDASVKKMVTEFERRRDYIYKRANKIKGFSSIKPEGAFYAFCRIDNLGLSSMDVCRRLLDEVMVAAVPGKAFGSDEHIRLSFATSMENIEKGMDRIEGWFEKNAG
ncbi:MAG: aminotransferase class I/II-fold pyridoxal phosphate-dependent enzyme, partial [Candidatus Omnitrophica bacterium]|nr:aminotransferase class I/II-fold pyridoxal phosphate-dependent enzyme [Candidatus Omnitrophota bacterium]